MHLLEQAKALEPELIRLRRDIHQNPEFGIKLPKTLATLVREIDGLGEVRTEPDISSATLLIRGAKPGPTVLLRADMDALALTEDTGLPFASTNGYMHACGHDLHVAIGVGAARLVHANRDSMAGNVLMFFQSGEEGHGGADLMLERNMHLDSGELPVAAYGIHVFSLGESGVFATRPGPLMASAGDMIVKFSGRGGHGSMPWLAKDPVSPMIQAMAAIQQLTTKSFSAFDQVIVNIGWIRAGETDTTNIVPEEASFGATIRTFSKDNFTRIRSELERLITSIADGFGVTATVEFPAASKVLLNDANAVEQVRESATKLFGQERFAILPDPMTGGEDFSSIVELVPGAFIFLSAGSPDHAPEQWQANHSNRAIFDESVIKDGAALLAQLAFDVLA
ncbi:MAG: M20 family metallopeptidase [Micrococcales bacterium]